MTGEDRAYPYPHQLGMAQMHQYLMAAVQLRPSDANKLTLKN